MTVSELESKLSASEYMNWVRFYNSQDPKAKDSEDGDGNDVDWSTADLKSIFNLEK